jgi:hypothetical protein
MVRIDQETAQKPIGYIDHFEVVMAQIPTKALYELQASIMQGVQSRARMLLTWRLVGESHKCYRLHATS